MNSKGEYTDRHGRVIAVGDFVDSSGEGDYPAGSARVLALPAEGNDYHGFPRLRFANGETAHVPDSVLERSTNYALSQVARLSPNADHYGIQLDDDEVSATKRMNITRDQLDRIAAILAEND